MTGAEVPFPRECAARAQPAEHVTDLATLAGWAGAGHNEQMYLQVERDNAAALALYQRAGFSERARYITTESRRRT
jgi:ribosomal protein S18 acetylase RimI-like enzyme